MSEQQHTHAEHGDQRIQAARQKYGQLADMSTDQLQERARQEGIQSPSQYNKEQLMQKLSGGGGRGGNS
jgi:hypothetical protein